MKELKDFTSRELKEELERRKEAEFVPNRYCIEGVWSGYRTEQSRVCHREYTLSKKFADEVKALRRIVYTDGTTLSLRVRPMKYREKAEREMTSYRSLIRECLLQGVNSVEALIESKGEECGNV